MVKLTFEVWEHKNGVAMFQPGAKNAKSSLKPPIRLLHTFQAETLYAAYQTYYDFMGWGRWNTKDIEDRAFTEEDIPNPDP
jgi:hypothetical protein